MRQEEKDNNNKNNNIENTRMKMNCDGGGRRTGQEMHMEGGEQQGEVGGNKSREAM